MHEWGDEWFEKYGDDLYNAIEYIEKELRRHHVGICGKEKYGSYRDDFLRFWDGGSYQILFGYRVHIGTFNRYSFKWMENLANKFHRFVYYIIDEGHTDKYFQLLHEYCSHINDKDKNLYFERLQNYEQNRKWKGLKHYMEKWGIQKLVVNHQADMYNRTFQRACRKWPHLIDELISEIDGYEMIKPGPYGNIDGVAIHNKYWKPVDNKAEE